MAVDGCVREAEEGVNTNRFYCPRHRDLHEHAGTVRGARGGGGARSGGARGRGMIGESPGSGGGGSGGGGGGGDGGSGDGGDGGDGGGSGDGDGGDGGGSGDGDVGDGGGGGSGGATGLAAVATATTGIKAGPSPDILSPPDIKISASQQAQQSDLNPKL